MGSNPTSKSLYVNMKFMTPIKFRWIAITFLKYSLSVAGLCGSCLDFSSNLWCPLDYFQMLFHHSSGPEWIFFLNIIQQTSECVYRWLFALKIKFVLEAMAVIIIDLNNQTRWKWTQSSTQTNQDQSHNLWYSFHFYLFV